MNRSDDPKVGQSILVLRETPATSDPTSSSSSSSCTPVQSASTPGQSQLNTSSSSSSSSIRPTYVGNNNKIAVSRNADEKNFLSHISVIVAGKLAGWLVGWPG